MEIGLYHQYLKIFHIHPFVYLCPLLSGVNRYCIYPNSIHISSLTKFHVLHEIIQILPTNINLYFFLKIYSLFSYFLKMYSLPVNTISPSHLWGQTLNAVFKYVYVSIPKILMALWLQNIYVWDCLAWIGVCPLAISLTSLIFRSQLQEAF